MKKLLIVSSIVGVFGFASISFALPYYQSTQGLVPFVNDQYYIGTSSPSLLEYKGIYTKDLVVSGTCTGCGGGSGGSAYAFPLSGNATSTLTQFNGGLTAYASSTIGNGTATGGLTISGNSTTTMDAFFNDWVSVGSTSPFAKFGISANPAIIYPTVFNISSSTAAGANSSLFSVTNTGLTGIGTSSPLYPLDVVGTGQVFRSTQNGGSGQSVFSLARVNHASQNNEWSFSISNGNGSLSNGSLLISPSGTSPAVTADLALSGLNAAAANNTANGLYIKGLTGNVGIGTTSPYAQLSVGTPYGATGATQTLFAIASSTANSTTTLFTITNTGRVGIGTNTPTRLLEISGLGTLIELGTNVGSDASISFQTNRANVGFSGSYLSGAGGTILQSGPGRGVAILSGTVGTFGAGTTTLYASSDQKIGIGTTSPYAKLSIHALNTETNTALFAIASSTANSTTTLFSVTNTGNVGINTSAPAFPLDVVTTGAGLQVVFSGRSSIGQASEEQAMDLGATSFTGGASKSFARISATAGSGFSTPVMKFWTDNGSGTMLERMRIDQAGNVGISTSSPFAKLSVATANGADGSQATLFAIASSTASATTTLFSISNTGKKSYNIGSSFGTTTLSSGAATVNTSQITVNSIVHLTLQNCSACGTVYLNSRTAGTSFTIGSTNVLDASIVLWEIIEPNF